MAMAGKSYITKTLSNGINALVAGESTGGTPIVCLSGWPETAEAYTEMMPFLAKNHHVLALDLPGLGGSAASADGHHDTNTVSRILAQAVEAELGPSTKYHLVGHDVGAWVAFPWAAAMQYGGSSSLLSLTLIDAIIPGLAALPEYPLPDVVNNRLWQFAFNRLPDLPEILVEGRERPMLDWLFDNKSSHPERITPAKRDLYVQSYSRPGGMTGGFAYYRAIPEVMEYNREVLSAGKLQVPILAVGGAQATGAMMKTALELTVDTERSRYVEVEDCGHYVPEEQPEVAAREILAVVAEMEK